MKNFKNDMAKIQTLIGEAFTATGSLTAFADGGTMDDKKLQRMLEKTSADFESAALKLRTLCEQYSPGKGGYSPRPAAPFLEVSGLVEKLGIDWLHIQLNTLLPHCRYQTPAWLSDTIGRLLDDYESRGHPLPYYPDGALLVIDEHSSIDGRQVFDQDNKGWKAVSNALKGRVFADDDQYTLSLSLLSQRSSENVCHITVLPLRDASDFFAFHSGDYVLGSIYERL